MKLDRRNEPKTFKDYRPLSRESLVRGEDRDERAMLAKEYPDAD